MNRLLLTTLGILATTLPARAIDIVYLDAAGKEFEVKGADIEESPVGITIKKGTAFEVAYVRNPPTAPRATRRTAPAKGVTFPIKVTPVNVKDYLLNAEEVKPVDHISYRAPLAKVDIAELNPALKPEARMKEYVDALPLFEALLPKLAGIPRAERHIHYRHCLTLYRLASSNEKYRQKAAEALTAFADKHTTGWQIAPALTMLAGLQEDANDTEGVQKTYDKLASVPGISEDIRVDSVLKSTGVLIKTEKFGDARTRLQKLQGELGGESPYKNKVSVYLAQCQVLGDNAGEAAQAEQQLRTLLTTSEDKALKGLAHNTLGDYYRKLKRDEDAFWEYLKVDTLYNEDRFEHSRAMYHLIQLFREVKKDADRSDSYLEQLTTNPRFAGLEYTKKALKK